MASVRGAPLANPLGKILLPLAAGVFFQYRARASCFQFDTSPSSLIR
jgi:hypothetical protein